MHILWDMDGVMISGRGTTHLANGYNTGDIRYFTERFLSECEVEGTPLYTVKRDDLKKGFSEWERTYNGGRSIKTVGELAACLTDMRHKLKVFPGAEQTIYTKNSILKGLSMEKIAEIAENLPYNEGLNETVESFRKSGLRQVLFSNSNEALVNAVARKFRFDYSTGASPQVILPDSSTQQYSQEFFGRSDVKLAGPMKRWNKLEVVMDYFDGPQGYSDLVVVDDTEIDMLQILKAKGAKVFGFYNHKDRDMKEEDPHTMKNTGITVLTNLTEFGEAVLAMRR